MKFQFINKENIDAYIATIVIGLKNSLAYKLDYILALFFNFINVLFMILIWSAVYLGTNVSSIKGLSLPDIDVYFFMIYALRGVVNTDLSSIMEEDIQSGGVATSYIKPLRYPIEVFMRSFSSDLLTMIFTTLPFFAIAILISHIALAFNTVLLLLVEILIAYILINLIGFLLGMTAIKLIYIGSLTEIIFTTMLLLGGGIIPLNMMPSIVQQILYISPFAIMLYIPATTFLGTVSQSVIITGIIAGLVWIIILTIAAFIAWGRLRRQITSAGG